MVARHFARKIWGVLLLTWPSEASVPKLHWLCSLTNGGGIICAFIWSLEKQDHMPLAHTGLQTGICIDVMPREPVIGRVTDFMSVVQVSFRLETRTVSTPTIYTSPDLKYLNLRAARHHAQRVARRTRDKGDWARYRKMCFFAVAHASVVEVLVAPALLISRCE